MDYHLRQDDNPDTLQIAMAVDTAPGTVVMLMRLATAIKKRSTEELMGLKMRQLMLLSYLNSGAPALQQQLCEALWLDAGLVRGCGDPMLPRRAAGSCRTRPRSRRRSGPRKFERRPPSPRKRS